MEERIEEEVRRAYKRIKNSGFEVYLVGGCVRDLLMNKLPHDWDLATNATPQDLQSIFPHSFYDNSFGTVGVPYGKEGVSTVLEITTYRRDVNYNDSRHPEYVEWGKDINDDLSRRDFTVNALALDLDSGKIIDPFEGRKDIEAKIIRAVGNPEARFKEDALRLARAIRFANQLDFEIEESTEKAIKNDAELILKISGERIRDELFKILASPDPYKGIMLLDKVGLLSLILPELARGKGVNQARPGRHHTEDVFTHNVLSLKFCPSINPIVRLATLIHDVGKPYVEGRDEEGYVIFYNHEVQGARVAREICDRLRLSKKQRDKIITLIRWHMFSVNENLTDSAVRRFIRRVGFENVKDMIDLRIGDRLGGGTQTPESWRLKKFKERIEEQLHPPFSMNDLVVNGNDVMSILGIDPGPKVGKILESLFHEVDQDLSKNNRDYLLHKMKVFKEDN